MPPASEPLPAAGPRADADAPPVAAADAHGQVRRASRRQPRRFALVPDGFTLLEVMIAMAILAIALVAVYQSQSQSISMSGSSRFLTTASLLAQSRMAEIDAADSRALAAGSGDFGDDFPNYQWQVEISDTELARLKKIVLSVTHSRMVMRNTYRLTLYKVVSP